MGEQGTGSKILNAVWEGIWVLNAQTKISYVNQEMADMLGYTATEMLGHSLFNFIDAAACTKAEECFKQLKQGVQKQHDFKFHHKDGSDLWVSVSINPMFGENDEFTGVVGLVAGLAQHKRDQEMTLRAEVAEAAKQQLEKEIAERKQAQEALAKSEAKFRSLIQNSSDVITLVTIDGTVLYKSPSVERVTGNKPEDAIGKSVFRMVHPEDVVTVVNAFNELVQHPGIALCIEFRFPRKDGSWCFMEATGSNLLDDPSVGCIVINARDITERKWAEEQLRHNALYDALTDLANRTLFMDQLGHALKLTKRHKNYAFAVLFLDLDRFKIINDSLGHAIGDQLLIAVSGRLKSCLREVDIIARFGGDEFAILLNDIKEINDAVHTAERIRKALMSPFNLSGREVFSSVSIGIAISTTGYNRPEDLLRDADTALYRAKALGKGRHEIFDADMHTHAVALLQLETDLRQAVERQELRIHYQPIISLETSRITGFEALVRWQHPQRGLVSPTEFIPVAEETGLIVPIGWWVLREACRQMQAWQAQLPITLPLAISVNLSVRQFTQPELIEQIDQILWETRLDASSLRLEITESVLIENPTSATAILSQLIALGIQLYMDDFGTGYSSLSYLHRFPVSALKIDRSFISRMGLGDKNSEIVRAITTLALALGIDVIAEGVETVEQLAQLNALKCKYGQGYLFSKPVVAEAAGALIMKNPQWCWDKSLIRPLA